MLFLSSFLLVLAVSPQASALDAHAEVAEARHLQAQGKLDAARERFEHALLANPRDPDALEGMSLTSEQISMKDRADGRMDDALADLMRAQRAEPDDKRVLYDLGIQEDQMRLDMDAVATLEHLRTLPPVNPIVYYALGRVDMNLDRLEAAEQMMQTYLAARPQDASAHYGLGSIYLKMLKFDKATEELQRSIDLQPKQSEAYYQLGEVELQQNHFDAAIKDYETTLARDPKHGGAMVGIGIANFKKKQFQPSKEWLVKATEVAPEYQPGHYYLGLALARLGESEASTKELALAAEMADKDNKSSASRLRIAEPGGRP